MNQRTISMKVPSFEAFLQANEQAKDADAARNEALNFAHPMDAGIIRVLDTPAVNKAFARLVDLSVDAQYGMILSTGLRVDNRQSQLADIVRHCSETLSISVPYTMISSSVTGLNAATIGTDEFVYVVISSLMEKMFDRDELSFVIGHECGHIALGHVLYHTVVSTVGSLSQLIPIIGPVIYQTVSWPLKAWSRRSEISADRAGLLCCKDVNLAVRTLLRLEAGFTSVDQFNAEEYIANANQWLKHSQIGYLTELAQDHPVLAKRMEALKIFADSEKYYRLSGQVPPAGKQLYCDAELDKRTEQIVKVIL